MELPTALRGLTSALLALLALSCSTNTSDPLDEVAPAAINHPDSTFESGGFSVERVKIQQIDSRRGTAGRDRSIAFNETRRLHGAIGNEEIRQRFGQYYTVIWDAPKTNIAPVTVVFEYRQQKTGAKILRLEQVIPDARKSTITEFAIVGEAFQQNGLVTSWQVTLLVDGQAMAAQPSYLWE